MSLIACIETHLYSTLSLPGGAFIIILVLGNPIRWRFLYHDAFIQIYTWIIVMVDTYPLDREAYVVLF